MPTDLAVRRSGPPISRPPIAARIVDQVFGYDFFIAYTRRDGMLYASALADELRGRGFRCFLDRSDFGAGDPLRGATNRALRKTSILVLVASPRAGESEYVRAEIAAADGLNRKIVPISIAETLSAAQGDPLREILGDRIWINEEEEALSRGPSKDVVGALLQSFQSTRQETKRLRVLGVILTVLLTLTLTAGWQWYREGQARARAEHQRALVLSGQALERLASGDVRAAHNFATESRNAWRDGSGKPDPSASYALARSSLVESISLPSAAVLSSLAGVLRMSRAREHRTGFVLETVAGDAALLSEDLRTVQSVGLEAGQLDQAIAGGSGAIFLLNNLGGIQEINSSDGRERRRQLIRIGEARVLGPLWSCNEMVCVALHSTKASRSNIEEIELNQLEGNRTEIVHPTSEVNLPSKVVLVKDHVAVLFQAKEGEVGSLAIYPLRGLRANTAASSARPLYVFQGVADVGLMPPDRMLLIRRGASAEVVEAASGRTEWSARLPGARCWVNPGATENVAIADCENDVLSVIDGRDLYVLPPRPAPILNVHVAVGFQAIVIARFDGVGEIVDYVTGATYFQWRAAPGSMRGAAYDADTTRLLVVSDNGQGFAWRLPLLERRTVTSSQVPSDVTLRSARFTAPAASKDVRFRELDVTVGEPAEASDVEWRNADPVFVWPEQELAVVNAQTGVWLVVGRRVARLLGNGDQAHKVVRAGDDGISVLTSARVYLIALSRLKSSSGRFRVREMSYAKTAEGADARRFLDLAGRHDGRVLIVGTKELHVLSQQLSHEELSVKRPGRGSEMSEIKDFWIEDDGAVLAMLSGDCLLVRIHIESGEVLSTLRPRC